MPDNGEDPAATPLISTGADAPILVWVRAGEHSLARLLRKHSPRPDSAHSHAGAEPHVRVFGTTTPALEEPADWLQELGVTTVAMESTDVYWIPLYELLQTRGIEVALANAWQLRHVPGRKSDLLYCPWLQLLHSCGLVRGSFRPGGRSRGCGRCTGSSATSCASARAACNGCCQ